MVNWERNDITCNKDDFIEASIIIEEWSYKEKREKISHWIKKIIQWILFISEKYKINLTGKKSEDIINELLSVLLNSNELSEYWLWKIISDIIKWDEVSKIRKELENRITATDNSAIVQEISIDWVIEYVNTLTEQITWFSSEELVWQDASIMKSWLHWANFRKRLWNTVMWWEVWKWIIANKKKDGSVYWVDTTITPMFDMNWQVEKFIVIRYDVTKLINMKKELSEKNRELTELAMKDWLTWLFNRRVFDQKLDEAIKTNKRVGIISFDIDNFTHFNNTYWHEVGDIVLKEVANVIKKSIRENDISVRYGWEEFMVILLDVDDELLKEISERIRLNMENIHLARNPRIKKLLFSMANEITNVTVSVWCTIYKEWEWKLNFLRRADDLLYRAKHSWKNKVIFE